MARLTAAEVARAVGGRLFGRDDRPLSGVRPLVEAGEEHLSFLANPAYRKRALASRAGTVVCAEGESLDGRDRIEVPDPYLALAVVVGLFHPPQLPSAGVHPQAVIGRDCKIGERVSIGALALVGDGCRLGDGVILYPGAILGEAVQVGPESVLHPRAVVYRGCRIGARVVLHAGVVVGSDGFGYAAHGGIHHKVPQVGSVVVEDDVEVGAGTTIDRGALGDTVIGAGSKIDNLVMIAHNVIVGPGSILVAQSGIAGSTRLGGGVIVAGQSGLAGHLEIGAGARVAAKSAVFQDVAPGATVAGTPAIPVGVWRRAQAAFARLPELLRRLRQLERRGDEREAE